MVRTEKLLKNRKKPSNALSDPGIELETPEPTVVLATTRRMKQQSIKNYLEYKDWSI